MVNRKIVYVISRDPFKMKGGRQFMILQWLRFLKDSVELSVICADEELSESLKAFLGEDVALVAIGAPSIRSYIRSLFLSRSWSQKWSNQERIFYKKIDREVIELLESSDQIFLDMIRVFSIIPSQFSKKVVVDYDDLLSLRYERMLLARETNFVGTYKSYFQKLGWVLSLFSKIILAWESKLIGARERQICRDVRLVGFVSSREAKAFSEKFGYDNVVTFPPSVKVSTEGFIKRVGGSSDCLILGFIGNNYSSHNRASLDYIFNFILPLLVERNIKFLFRVAGDTPNDMRQCNVKAVEFFGEVESVDDFYANVHALLCPMTMGSGVKIKIIESLARGVPVITNSIGAEGLDELVLKYVSVFDDPITMVDGICAHNYNISQNRRSEIVKEVDSVYGESNVKSEFLKRLVGEDKEGFQ